MKVREVVLRLGDQLLSSSGKSVYFRYGQSWNLIVVIFIHLQNIINKNQVKYSNIDQNCCNQSLLQELAINLRLIVYNTLEYQKQIWKIIQIRLYNCQMQYTTQVTPLLQSTLDLIDQLQAKCTLSQLQSFVKTLSEDQDLVASLIQALQIIPIDPKGQRFICLYISKALDLSDFATFETKCYLALLSNWRLDFQARQVLQNGLRNLLSNSEIDQKSIFMVFLSELEQIIKQIACSPDNTQAHQSSPILIEDHRFVIQACFPDDINSIAHTYLILLKCVLETTVEYFDFQVLDTISTLECINNLRLLVFNRANILSNPQLFVKFIDFYQELDEVTVASDPNNQNIGKFTLEAFCGWTTLGQDMTLIYSVLCDQTTEHKDNFLACFYSNYDSSQDLLNLKIMAAEFHQLTLTKFRQHAINHPSILQLDLIFNALCSTTSYFLSLPLSLNEDADKFIANLLLLLVPYLQKTQLSSELVLNFFVAYGLPLCQRAITLQEMSGSTGDELHNYLDACCEIQDVSSLLSTSTLIISQLFEQDPIVYSYFKQLCQNTLIRTNTSQLSQGQFEAINRKTIFLILTLLSFKDEQEFKELADILADLISQQFLMELDSEELKYFYFLLECTWNTIYQDKEDLCVVIFDFCFKQTTNKTPDFEYFALSYIGRLFEQVFYEDWFVTFIQHFYRFSSLDCLALKWSIIQTNAHSSLHECDKQVIRLFVVTMREGASKQLTRMLNQKQNKRAIDYGQVKYYLASCRNLVKKMGNLSQETKEVACKEILSFLSLIEMASVFDLETDLVRMAVDLLPSLNINEANIVNINSLYEQFLLCLFQKEYKSQLLFLTILKMLNFLQRKEIKVNHSGLLAVVQAGLKSIDHHKLCKSGYTRQEQEKKVMTLGRLMLILQKYLICFGLPQKQPEKTAFLNCCNYCKALIIKFEEDLDLTKPSPFLRFGWIVFSARIVELIISLELELDIDYTILIRYITFGFFREYDTFLLIWLIHRSAKQCKTAVNKIFKLCECLLLFSKHYLKDKPSSIVKFNARTLELQKQTSDILNCIHKNIDAKLFKPTLEQQIWMLIDRVEKKMSAEDKRNSLQFGYLNICRSITEEKDEKYLRLLISARDKKEVELKKQYYQIGYGLTTKCGYDKATLTLANSDRKIVRVTGDKIQDDRPFLLLSSSFASKRTYGGMALSEKQNGQQDFLESYYPNQGSTYIKSSSKIIVDNSLTTFRNSKSNDQDAWEQEPAVSNVWPATRIQHSWNKLTQSMAQLRVSHYEQTRLPDN